MKSVTFDDGFTVSVGQRVRFHSKRGSEGGGIVTKITPDKGGAIFIAPDDDAIKGGDYWPLNAEAASLAGRPDYWGPRDSGVAGGCIERCDHDWQADTPCDLVDTCAKCGEQRA